MKHKHRVIGLSVLTAVALFAIVIGAIYGLTQYYKPAEDISAKVADVSVAADKLFAAYETNEQQANNDYLNKVISVTGPIGEISTNQQNEKVLILRTPDMLFGVFCTLLPAENDKVSTLREGQNVTVKGLCTGYTTDVVLTNCSLVE